MNSIKFTSILFLCFISFTCSSQNIKDSVNDPISMFKNWVSGVKNKNLEKFKDGYSQENWDKMSKKEKNELLNEYSIIFDLEFKKYKIEDFEISFQGNGQKGKLIIFFKGKEFPSLKVKKVKNDWVLAEK